MKKNDSWFDGGPRLDPFLPCGTTLKNYQEGGARNSNGKKGSVLAMM